MEAALVPAGARSEASAQNQNPNEVQSIPVHVLEEVRIALLASCCFTAAPLILLLTWMGILHST